MLRVFLTVLFFMVTLNARENPFFPAEGEKDIPYTTNQKETLTPLNRVSVTLPSTARVIQKVTLEYKNLDGSVKTKSINLNNSIDWHLPLFISQSYTTTIQKKPIKLKNFTKVGSYKYGIFYVSDKTLKIVTKDEISRNFLLVEPHRIVLDFDADVHLNSYVKSIQKSVFSKIRIGNHDKYYRVVIELDGKYIYSFHKIDGGYEIILK